MADTKSLTSEFGSLSEGSPATDMSKVLMRLIAGDLDKFKRNILSSRHVVRSSRSIYDAICQLITKVETATSVDWDSFDTYTNAIEPLEDLLLRFAFSQYDKTQEQIPSGNSIDDCLVFIGRWKAERDVINKALKTLSQKEFKDLSIQIGTGSDNRSADDSAILKALTEAIAKSGLADNRVVQQRGGKLVTELKALAGDIQTKFEEKKATLSLESAEIVIKIVMLVYSAMVVLMDPSTTKEWVVHLRGPTIWLTAKNILTLVKSHLQSGTTPTTEELITKYNEFAALLVKHSGNLDVSQLLLELIKLAGKVRRPFHGQSVAFVRLCRYLEEHSASLDNRYSADRKFLKVAIEESIVALKKAESTQSVMSAQEYIAAATKAAEPQFASAKAKIKSCFESFELSQKWTDEYQAKLDNAEKVDKDHFERFKSRLNPPAKAA